jgi:hypothetical protein
MGFNDRAEKIFHEMAAEAVAKAAAEREIEKNRLEIDQLNRDIEEIEYLVKVVPDPSTDHIILRYAASKKKLLDLLLERNRELDGRVALLDEISALSRRHLN